MTATRNSSRSASPKYTRPAIYTKGLRVTMPMPKRADGSPSNMAPRVVAIFLERADAVEYVKRNAKRGAALREP